MLGFLKAGWALVKANPWRAAAIALVLALAALSVRVELVKRSLTAEKAGHELTKRDLVQARLNRQLLEKGIADQNASIEALAEAGRIGWQKAAEAEKRAAEQRGRTEALRSRLIAESRQTGGKPAVALTSDQEAAWNALQ